ncbi:MAG TPA: zf-HC2 domain-containing protein [Rudaea sp.]|nr:zf-HC2 domain-containing protein [Burkholderiaceae bacterium]HSE13345.1 zf-HC2 domain-containing protein [Rudaea sp.]
MHPNSEIPACEHEASLLLPWYVNATLSAADVKRVENHLEHCDACRADIDEQRQLGALMRAPASIEHSPKAGWRKLQARIEAGRQIDAALPVARYAGWRPTSRPVAWLVAVAVVQSVALLAIAGSGLLGWSMSEMAPRYRTLTSAPAASGVRLRVAFAPATTLGELTDLLHANQLVAISGPSDAGLFTLAMLPSNADMEAQRAVLARLRADPRVRFADVLGANADTR